MSRGEKLKYLRLLQERVKNGKGYEMHVVFEWVQEFLNTAMQLQIEMLEPKDCKHENKAGTGAQMLNNLRTTCLDCGIELVAEWKPK